MQHEGYRHIHDRARELLDSQTGNNQVLHEFVQIPEQMFQFGHDVERMNYGSQQFRFPVPGYHPDPPNTQPDAYYQSNPVGGYYTPPPPPQDDANNPESFVNQLFAGTPTSPYNLYGGSSNTMQNMGPINEHREFGRRTSAFSPVAMGSLSEFGTSQNPSESRNRDINLADDEDEQEIVEPEQQLQGRGHRRQYRRGCGTHGRY